MNIEEALDKYLEHFKKPYPLVISQGLSDEEIVDNIEMCINTDTPAEEPEYDDECDY